MVFQSFIEIISVERSKCFFPKIIIYFPGQSAELIWAKIMRQEIKKGVGSLKLKEISFHLPDSVVERLDPLIVTNEIKYFCFYYKTGQLIKEL